jgi:hypothetical protein
MLEDVTETSLAGSRTLTWILFPLNIDRVVFESEEITEYQKYQMKTKDPDKLQNSCCLPLLGNVHEVPSSSIPSPEYWQEALWEMWPTDEVFEAASTWELTGSCIASSDVMSSIAGCTLEVGSLRGWPMAVRVWTLIGRGCVTADTDEEAVRVCVLVERVYAPAWLEWEHAGPKDSDVFSRI